MKRTKRSRALISALLVLAVASGVSAYIERATIVVSSSEIHEFKGLKASTHNWRGYYQRLPRETREQLANALWRDAQFNLLRLWAFSTDTDTSFANRYKQYYEDVKRVNPSVIVLLGPTGTIGDLEAYAAFYCSLIKKIQDNFDIHISATGIANEPNMGENLVPAQVPALIKLFRKHLDALGLDTIRIIAPETSNVDDIAFQMFDRIVEDRTALDNLHAFSTHSC